MKGKKGGGVREKEKVTKIIEKESRKSRAIPLNQSSKLIEEPGDGMFVFENDLVIGGPVAATPQVQGSNPGLGNFGSAFYPFNGLIVTYQARLGTKQ
ncbi:hypothetical protein TNCV_999681 [Trichonephila clavipes]|nr:hypothetical protein TNCV_999681 [Trichonephila clavipes]